MDSPKREQNNFKAALIADRYASAVAWARGARRIGILPRRDYKEKN